MADEKLLQAQKMYAQVCAVLDKRDWVYDKDEEKLTLFFSVNGDGLPIPMIVTVDTERALLQVFSPLSFEINEKKMAEFAVAVCIVNDGKADGCFDYDMYKNRICYRLVAKYEGCRIGDEFIEHMIDWTCTAVDKYSDKFLALNKGVIDVKDFIKEE